MRRCKAWSRAAALILILSACSREGEMPRPPQSPPRPTTYGGGHAFTAQLDLAVRPRSPSSGEM